MDHETQDWNDAEVEWHGLGEGLAAAARDNKPVFLVLYTTWCPHCHNTSWLFHDPELVEASRQYVMVRIDCDAEPELSARYAPDGEYVPRVFVVNADGSLQLGIRPHRRDEYRYFPNEYQTDEILAMMRAGLAQR